MFLFSKIRSHRIVGGWDRIWKPESEIDGKQTRLEMSLLGWNTAHARQKAVIYNWNEFVFCNCLKILLLFFFFLADFDKKHSVFEIQRYLIFSCSVWYLTCKGFQNLTAVSRWHSVACSISKLDLELQKRLVADVFLSWFSEVANDPILCIPFVLFFYLLNWIGRKRKLQSHTPWDTFHFQLRKG